MLNLQKLLRKVILMIQDEYHSSHRNIPGEDSFRWTARTAPVRYLPQKSKIQVQKHFKTQDFQSIGIWKSKLRYKMYLLKGYLKVKNFCPRNLTVFKMLLGSNTHYYRRHHSTFGSVESIVSLINELSYHWKNQGTREDFKSMGHSPPPPRLHQGCAS